MEVGMLAVCSLVLGVVLLWAPSAAARDSAVGRVQELAPGVFFYEGDTTKGHCNNAWVVFDEFVLVVDANYPSGAREAIAKIREQTDKPIRFAFDTHHHGDHLYGNRVWADAGATPVAHAGVIDELKKYESGYYGGAPGRWESTARERDGVRASRLMPPTLTFPDSLVFDDGTHRVELLHLGVAHTHGDAVAWLPREGILFSGDAVVNGAFNYVGDGDTGDWIETLDRVQALAPRQVGPGHGPLGDGAMVRDQAAFFGELRRVVAAAAKDGEAAEVQRQVPAMRAELEKNPAIARYVGDGFAAQAAKVYTELTGEHFPDRRAEADAVRRHQAWHGSPGGPPAR
jgi:cyclase